MEKIFEDAHLRLIYTQIKYSSIHIKRDKIPGITEDYVKLFVSAYDTRIGVSKQSSLKVRYEIREAKAEEPIKISRSLQRPTRVSQSLTAFNTASLVTTVT